MSRLQDEFNYSSSLQKKLKPHPCAFTPQLAGPQKAASQGSCVLPHRCIIPTATERLSQFRGPKQDQCLALFCQVQYRPCIGDWLFNSHAKVVPEQWPQPRTGYAGGAQAPKSTNCRANDALLATSPTESPCGCRWCGVCPLRGANMQHIQRAFYALHAP